MNSLNFRVVCGFTAIVTDHARPIENRLYLFDCLILFALVTWACLWKLFLSLDILKTPLAIVSKVDN
jgi:hypothetical protein